MSTLDDDYAHAGFARRLGWGTRPGLLLVDPVAAYTTPDSPLFLSTGSSAVTAMVSLVDTFRAAGLPIAYTGVRYADESCAEAPLFAAKAPVLRVFAAGNPLGALAAPLAPADGEPLFLKQYASAFAGTPVAAWLVSHRVDTVVIGGFSTSGCIRASAVDALQHGLRPIVVRDACADRAPGPHEANLFDLDAKYADVITLPEALTHLHA